MVFIRTTYTFIRPYILIILFFSIGLPASAQDEVTDVDETFSTDLDELILTILATMTEQTAEETPASVTVVSGDTIRSRGYTTIKQVMKNVRGFNDLADSNEDTTAIRGVFTSTNNKYIVMINSHRMNDLTLGRYDLDALIGMGAVERIEFLRGAASSIYGAGALIGAINVITRNRYEGEELSYRTGNNSYHKAEYTKGFTLDNAHFLINFSYLDSKGEDIDQPAFLDQSLNKEGFVNVGRYPDNWVLNLITTTKASELTIHAEHKQRATPRLPGSTPGFFDYDKEPIKVKWEDTRFFIDYKSIIEFENSSIVINPSYHYSDMNNLSFLLETAEIAPPDGKLVGETAKENRFQLKIIYKTQLKDNLLFMAGIDHLHVKFSDAKNYSASAGQNLTVGNDGSFFPDARWTMGGYFLQAIWQVTSTFEVTANTRYDTFQSQADSRITNKLAFVYSPNGPFTSKLIYAESYMSPMWQHKHSGNPSFSANPNLDSETFSGINWITHYYFNMNTTITADIFKNDAKDIINSTNNIYVNSGDITVWGVEVELDVRYSEALNYGGSISYVDPDKSETSDNLIADNKIKSISPITTRYFVSYQAFDNHRIQLQGRIANEFVMNDNAFNNDVVDVNAYHVLDFQYNYQAFSNLTLDLFADNVFDETYEIGGSKRPMPQPGRLIGLQATWIF